MVLKFIDSKIRDAFSNAAVQYDVLTGLHKEIGRELVKKIAHREDARYVLDIGMGTGWLTNRLSYFFPEARVVGIDVAPGMLMFAQNKHDGFDILQASALHLPFKNNSFDIIASNLALQWVSDLPQAARECHAALKEGGTMVFTMFGHDTLTELFASLSHAMGEEQKMPFTRLAKREDMRQALAEAGFKNIASDYERIKVHFPTMADLIQWIRDIGANALNPDVFIGKRAWQSASAYYDQHFREHLGIYATFEVLWFEAVKNN